MLHYTYYTHWTESFKKSVILCGNRNVLLEINIFSLTFFYEVEDFFFLSIIELIAFGATSHKFFSIFCPLCKCYAV